MKRLLNIPRQNTYETLNKSGTSDECPDPNPEDSSSHLSNLFLWWLFPILRQTQKNGHFTPDEIFRVRQRFRSKILHDKFLCEWKKKKGKLTRTLIHIFKTQILAFFFAANVLYMMPILQVYLIGNITEYFNNKNIMSSTYSYLSAAGIIIISFLYCVLKGKLLYEELRVGMLMKVVLGAAVHNHMMLLPLGNLMKVGSGEIMTLMSTDLELLNEVPRLSEAAFSTVLVNTVIFWLLFREIGIYGLIANLVLTIGLIVMALPMPIIPILRGEIATKTAMRIQMMRNILHNIETIKINCWEKPMGLILNKLRRAEFLKIIMLLITKFAAELYVIFVPWVTLLSIVAVYVYKDDFIKPESLVRIVGYIYICSWNNANAVIFFANLFQGYKSLLRIEKFLVEEITPKSKDSKHVEYAVRCDFLTAAWPTSQTEILRNISFQLAKGQLMVVAGPTGSGKSSLLMTLLGHLEITSGDKSILNNLAYCPQQPWIFLGTVQENILLGSPLNMKKYEETITACCLLEDLGSFPYGDKTLIGERGITLSGGQKARICLARSIYQESDLFLLDDPLSAVDSEVGLQIFHKCFKGFLANKTTIVVTHQTQFLPLADVILLLNKNGEVEYYGKFDSERCGSIANQGSKHDNNVIQMMNSYQSQTQVDIEQGLVEKTSKEGNITFKIYWDFFKAGKGWITLFPLFLVGIAGSAFWKYSDYYLAIWSDDSVLYINGSYPYDPYQRLAVYTGMIVAYQIYGLLSVILVLAFIIMASKNLHDKMFEYVLGAQMSFFSKPLGIIINRFARDLGIIDMLVIYKFFLCCQFTFMLVATIGFSCVTIPWLPVQSNIHDYIF